LRDGCGCHFLQKNIILDRPDVHFFIAMQLSTLVKKHLLRLRSFFNFSKNIEGAQRLFWWYTKGGFRWFSRALKIRSTTATLVRS
jgi:hypothetical protein